MHIIDFKAKVKNILIPLESWDGTKNGVLSKMKCSVCMCVCVCAYTCMCAHWGLVYYFLGKLEVGML